MGCRDDVNTSGESGHGIVNKAIAHESEIDNIISLIWGRSTDGLWFELIA